MGSKQLCMFLLFTTHFSVVLQMIWMHVLLPDHPLQATGPYPALGAVFGLFHLYTPRLYPRFVSVLGFCFSEKAFFYLWFVQVATAVGYQTAVPVLAGWCSCMFFLQMTLLQHPHPDGSSSSSSSSAASQVTRLHRLPMTSAWLDALVPTAAVRSLGALGMRLAGDGLPRILVPAVTAAAAGGRRGTAGLAAAAAGGAAAGRPPSAFAAAAAAAAQQQQQQQQQRAVVTPDPASVEQLCGMGFAREQVMEALRQCNNDVMAAADRLLTQTAGS